MEDIIEKLKIKPWNDSYKNSDIIDEVPRMLQYICDSARGIFKSEEDAQREIEMILEIPWEDIKELIE